MASGVEYDCIGFGWLDKWPLLRHAGSCEDICPGRLTNLPGLALSLLLTLSLATALC